MCKESSKKLPFLHLTNLKGIAVSLKQIIRIIKTNRTSVTTIELAKRNIKCLHCQVLGEEKKVGFAKPKNHLQ
jgi:hypothetical protein